MKPYHLILFLVVYTLHSQEPTTNQNLNTAIKKQTAAFAEELIEIRRDFHRFPEVAGEEQRTAKIIAEYLTNNGLEVHQNIGGYGVVGILNTGKPGKKIAWRADIDALPTDLEDDPVDFKSENSGVRHICGHDVHTVIGMGIAKNVAALKDQLSGTYYFVFQPAEENITGAKAMLEDGLLELIQPDEFYALHLTPFPTGVIATKPNELYAHYKKVVVTLNTTNPKRIDKAKEIIDSFDNVSNDQFGSPASFESERIGIFGYETLYKNYSYRESDFFVNESEDKTTITSYFSFSNADRLAEFKQGLQERLQQDDMKELSPKLAVKDMSYVLKNDSNVTQEAMAYFKQLPKTFIELIGVFPGGRSDDFALFLDKVPGTYFFLGASDYANGIISMPHDPNFQVDESVIEKATNTFTRFMAHRAWEE